MRDNKQLSRIAFFQTVTNFKQQLSFCIKEQKNIIALRAVLNILALRRCSGASRSMSINIPRFARINDN